MIFEKNIEALRVLNPELTEAILRTPRGDDLQILDSKTGHPSLRVGHVTLHSHYDPIKEAESWVEYYKEKIERASSVVVLGFGLGYHIIELYNTAPKKIVVFEPRPDVLKTAFELTDFTSLFPKVKFVADEEIPEINKGFVIATHTPSVSLNPGYFERLHSRLKVLQRINRGLRIMVVGPLYGGSLSIAQYTADALKSLGHKVDFFNSSLYKDAFLSIPTITSDKTHQDKMREMFVHFVSEAIVARCGEFKPDLVVALAQAPLGANALRKLRDYKIPTAFWFVEDFRLMDYWQGVAPFYDYFFTIQKGKFFNKLTEAGIRNFSYLPLAAPIGVHRKLKLTPEEIEKYGSDISFVGAGYYNRRNFLTGLIDFDLKIWGSEWDMGLPLARCIQRSGQWIETEEIVKIFNATKININLHSSQYHKGVNPHGDFINPRTFEIAACEGFQLVDFRSEMLSLFRIGSEVVCFEDLNDLRYKIRYYLENPEERSKVARCAQERVVKEHTYEHRMKEMLHFLFKNGYEPPPWRSEGEDVESLIETAGRDTDLGDYLTQFIDNGDIGLDDIVEKITKGTGSLTEVEKIFLMINEIKKQYAVKN